MASIWADRDSTGVVFVSDFGGGVGADAGANRGVGRPGVGGIDINGFGARTGTKVDARAGTGAIIGAFLHSAGGAGVGTDGWAGDRDRTWARTGNRFHVCTDRATAAAGISMEAYSGDDSGSAFDSVADGRIYVVLGGKTVDREETTTSACPKMCPASKTMGQR